jgi:hypothetical protein
MVGDTEHWDPPSPMHHARSDFTCATVARCIIVAGGRTASTEVYDEALDRWIRLPCDFPSNHPLEAMSSALSL